MIVPEFAHAWDICKPRTTMQQSPCAGQVHRYRHSFARMMQTHRAGRRCHHQLLFFISCLIMQISVSLLLQTEYGVATPVASGATTATATPLSLQPSSTSSQQPLGASTTKTLPATLKLSASTGQASPSSVESSDMSTSGIAGSIPNLSPAPTADLGSPTCSLQLQSGTLLPLLSGPYY
ncbi:hypothetical protein Vretifemale_4659, partial [Volvox reticuliferus]